MCSTPVMLNGYKISSGVCNRDLDSRSSLSFVGTWFCVFSRHTCLFHPFCVSHVPLFPNLFSELLFLQMLCT